MKAKIDEGVPHEDHLVEKLAVGAGLLAELPKEEEKLLHGLVLLRHAEANDRHEELGERLSIQCQEDDLLESRDLDCEISIFELFLQLRHRDVDCVVVDEKCAGALSFHVAAADVHSRLMLRDEEEWRIVRKHRPSSKHRQLMEIRGLDGSNRFE